MLDPRISKESVNLIINWCYNKLGKSRFHRSLPKLIVYKKKPLNNRNIFGEYSDRNIINIYLYNNEDIHKLIDTVIHEYWHYKQNPKGYKYVFSKPNWEEDYKNLPYEISARNKAKKYKKICYEELFKLNY